jgi:CoA-dependent NAD(P)H sulfur oxidoreductase
MMKFVVIGGDAAGMSAASRAKRNWPELEITVLEKTMDVSYSACGMPYNIADPKRPIDDLVVRSADVFRKKQGIKVLTGHFGEKIDRGKQMVHVISQDKSSFEIAYDKLLIATGAHPIIPELPGFDLEGIMALKSLEDGRKIKQYIKENNVKNVVILGMGYIALEMCEALRALKMEVSMVKPRKTFIPWMHPDMADTVKKEVESNGVKLYTGYQILGAKQSDGHLHIICDDDLILDAEMVLVGIGIAPNNKIALDAGLELGVCQSISVDKMLKTSDENIYAAGDCADSYHVVTGKKTWIPLALRANRSGWAVADNVCGKQARLEGVAGTAVFKVFNLEISRTGLNPQEAAEAGFDPADVTVTSRSRAHAHPGSQTIQVQMVGDKKSGRLLGAFMVGAEGVAHRINAAAVALHNHMTVEAFSTTDLSYAPPFGPVWDPLLTASNQLLKEL